MPAIEAWIAPLRLQFAFTARTSRNAFTHKTSWVVRLHDPATGATGFGECAPLPGLSREWTGSEADYERLLRNALARYLAEGAIPEDTPSSIRMGIESAIEDKEVKAKTTDALFDIPINGLVWINSKEEMLREMRNKVAQGFRCIKIKIGSLGSFESELEMLEAVREEAPDAMLRLDANGAFSADEALDKLRELSRFQVHSIEQPIAPGQRREMARLAALSPIPIALDEELTDCPDPAAMLREVKPAYIVVKPTLHGGLSGARKWVATARQLGIGSWLTSALESNIGLHAIGRLAAELYGPSPEAMQGLGTGKIFTANVPGPVELRGSRIVETDAPWNMEMLNWLWQRV